MFNPAPVLLMTATLTLAACAAGPTEEPGSADPPAPSDARTDSPTPTIEQIAGSWTLRTIDAEELAEELKDRPPTFAVNEQGHVSGFAGVNRYTATLDPEKLKAGTFDVSNLGMTRMAGPPERMKLEQAFTSRLVDASAAAIRDGTLQLSHEGRITLTFSRDPSAPQSVSLEQLRGDWTLTHLRGEPLADNVKDKPPTFSVDEEGRVGGFAGVNRYFGALDLDKLKQGVFTAGPLGSTLMAGPPERMDLEKAFTDALQAANRATLQEDTLQLTEDDQPCLTFIRVR